MCRSRTKEMPYLWQMVSDHQCQTHQILRRICAGGQAAPYLSADWQSERQNAAGACRRSSNKTGICNPAEYHNLYIKRGTLDAELAKTMKKLAKDKMLRAISDVAYARGDYEKEMEQDALQREAEKIIRICGGKV